LFFPSELNELFDGRNGLSFPSFTKPEELDDEDEILLDSPSFTPIFTSGTNLPASAFNSDSEDELSLFALGEFEEPDDGKEFTLIALGELEETDDEDELSVFALGELEELLDDGKY
jgi:hypothetical protein